MYFCNMAVNKALDLDIKWIESIKVNDILVISEVANAKFTNKSVVSEHLTAEWLSKAIGFVDLALLVGDETPQAISQLCHKAAFPMASIGQSDDSNAADGTGAHCAAVCIYPLRIEDAFSSLAALNNKTVKVASVAAGFPAGQFPLHTRLAEIYYAVAMGAHEIDVVIDRSLVLRGLWQQLYNELVEMRKACSSVTLKVILSATECGSLTNVYKAAAVAMSAGADFIKTSTGKETLTVTMHEGFVMCEAIKDFLGRTGVKVGLKPAGGIRTAEQAISWMLMVQQVLGNDWVNPTLFRIGTSLQSTLVDNLGKALLEC